MMLSGACRRVLRSSASIRCTRREVIHGPLGAAARGRVRALRMLSTSSTEEGTAIAVEPEHIRNIAIIAHVGKCLGIDCVVTGLVVPREGEMEFPLVALCGGAASLCPRLFLQRMYASEQTTAVVPTARSSVSPAASNQFQHRPETASQIRVQCPIVGFVLVSRVVA